MSLAGRGGSRWFGGVAPTRGITMGAIQGAAFAVLAFWLFEAVVFVCSYRLFSKT